MIKLYDADQNPMAILVAMDDRSPLHPRFGGRHGHGHHGHHGHGHGHGHKQGMKPKWGHHGRPVPDMSSQSAANHHDGDNKQTSMDAPWRGRCAIKSAFINAFDAFAEMAGQTASQAACANAPPSAPNVAPKAAAAASENNGKVDADTAATEQALIEQAVRASLEENEKTQSTTAAAAVSQASVVQAVASTAATASSAANPSSFTPTPAAQVVVTEQAPAVASKQVEAKPAMRFVRDVTFPDGTKVQPGSVFVKTWRVRNDGAASWTAGTVLVTAGGDLLTAADLSISVPLATSGEEVDISATMTAPAATGRHTAYFRLQKDGTSFGQRLWADVRVEDVDPSWFVLDASQTESDAVLVAPSPAASLVLVSSASQSIQSNQSAQLQTAEAAKAPVDPVDQQPPSPVAVPAVQVSAPAAAHMPNNVADVAMDVWTRVWAAELSVLAQMGFTDVAALVPILQEHIQVPAALSDNKRVSPDAVQAVVLHILGNSV